MECYQCHTSLDGKPCWGSTDEKTNEAIYLCEDCFKAQYGGDDQVDIDLAAPIEDEIICHICHRVLDENEEYLQDDQTGLCYCFDCFEEHRNELTKQ